MVTALALAAAVCFALGNVAQQRGTLDTEAGEGDPRFLVQILRKPVWLAGEPPSAWAGSSRRSPSTAVRSAWSSPSRRSAW